MAGDSGRKERQQPLLKASIDTKQSASNNVTLTAKDKIAEEIKLNVAAVGMELLHGSSTAAPKVVSKVNNLVDVTSPKGLGGRSHDIEFEMDETVIEADDETSPDRDVRSSGKHKLQSLTLSNKQESQLSKINIQHIENTDESEEVESPAHRSLEEDEGDFTRRLKQSQFKHVDLPPPLELIAKTTYKEEEPIKTGAPIPFLSLASLAGGRFLKEEACGKTKAEKQ